MLELFRIQEDVEIPIGFIQVSHEKSNGMVQANPIWILPIHINDIENHRLSLENLVVYSTFETSILTRWIDDQADRKVNDLMKKGA
jgi:hypothetical protein